MPKPSGAKGLLRVVGLKKGEGKRDTLHSQSTKGS